MESLSSINKGNTVPVSLWSPFSFSKWYAGTPISYHRIIVPNGKRICERKGEVSVTSVLQLIIKVGCYSSILLIFIINYLIINWLYITYIKKKENTCPQKQTEELKKHRIIKMVRRRLFICGWGSSEAWMSASPILPSRFQRDSAKPARGADCL